MVPRGSRAVPVASAVPGDVVVVEVAEDVVDVAAEGVVDVAAEGVVGTGAAAVEGEPPVAVGVSATGVGSGGAVSSSESGGSSAPSHSPTRFGVRRTSSCRIDHVWPLKAGRCSGRDDPHVVQPRWASLATSRGGTH